MTVATLHSTNQPTQSCSVYTTYKNLVLEQPTSAVSCSNIGAKGINLLAGWN